MDTSLRWIQVYDGYKFTIDTSLRWIQVYDGYKFTIDTPQSYHTNGLYSDLYLCPDYYPVKRPFGPL